MTILTLTHQSEIEKKKKEAKQLYLKIQSELNTVNCGIHMLSIIRPSFGLIVDQYDSAIDWLRKNDPKFPK